MKKNEPAYIEAQERLKRIFIREKDASGKWVNVNLNDVTDEQFAQWFKNYLYNRFKFECEEVVCKRVGLVEFLDNLGLSPAEVRKTGGVSKGGSILEDIT